MVESLRRQFQKTAIVSRLADVAGRATGWRKWRPVQPVALVIDDDPDIAPLVKIALGSYAISSDDVHDGTSALARLRARHYDLVILDLGMEGLNGFDVLLALKKEASLRATPVIVLTASSSDESLARSFGYGADDFMVKPFKTTELGMRAYRLLYPLTIR